MHSHSPDENSSQCSLDSELNHSREEEELKSLGLGNRYNDSLLDNDVDKLNSSKFNQYVVFVQNTKQKQNKKPITNQIIKMNLKP